MAVMELPIATRILAVTLAKVPKSALGTPGK
jgi:hypothetical protein